MAGESRKFSTYTTGATNLPPVAVLAVQKIEALIGSIIQLDGRSSYDPERKSLAFLWKFVSVPLGSKVTDSGFKSIRPKGSAVSFIPDIIGQYVVSLTVSDGELESEPVSVVANIQLSRVPVGENIIPDAQFLWNYISNFWNLVGDREKITTVWSGVIQVLGSEIHRLWSNDYNKSIETIQPNYQRRWFSYSTDTDLESFYDQRLIVGKSTSGNRGYTGTVGQTQPEGSTSVAYVTYGKANSVVPLVATYTWSGNAVVKSADTSEVRVGDWVRLDSDGRFFEVGSVENGFSITVKNPNQHPIPVGNSRSSKKDLVRTDFTNLQGNYGVKGRVVVVNGETYTISRAENKSVDLFSGNATVDAGTNKIEDLTATFLSSSIRIGDRITLSGVNAGTYQVTQVLTDTVLALAHEDTKSSVPVFLADLPITYKAFRSHSFVVTDEEVIPSGQVGVSWRVPNLLHVPGIDFEEEGVSPGDILVLEVSSSELSGLSAELRAQVVGVDRSRIGFEFSLDSLVPGSPTVDRELFRQLVKDLRLTKVQDSSLQVAKTAEAFISSIPVGVNLNMYTATDFYFQFRAKKIIHTKVLKCPDELVSVPVLQEKIKDPPLILRENMDYVVDSGRIRFLDSLFSAKEPPPSKFWAEISLMDNSQTIENNFGLLVDLGKNDLTKSSTNVPYLGAVKGLMYAYSNGSSVNNVRLGLQILLGLPFTEEKGKILEIQEAFSLNTDGTMLGRILMEDIDDNGNLSGYRRMYFYPASVGLEINPATGQIFKVGEILNQFTPLSKGVDVVDYVKDPYWWKYTLGGVEILKFFTFKTLVDSDIFDSNDLKFALEFLKSIKPAFTKVIVTALVKLSDDIAVSDTLGTPVTARFFDNPWGLPSCNRTDGAGFGFVLFRLDSNPFTVRVSRPIADLVTYRQDSSLSSSILVSSARGWDARLIRGRSSFDVTQPVVAGDILAIAPRQPGASFEDFGLYEIDVVLGDNTLRLLQATTPANPISNVVNPLDPALFEYGSSLRGLILRRETNPIVKGDDLETRNYPNNEVSSSSALFSSNSVSIGDWLIIEPGADPDNPIHNYGQYKIEALYQADYGVSPPAPPRISESAIKLVNPDGSIPDFQAGVGQKFRVVKNCLYGSTVTGCQSIWSPSASKITLQALDPVTFEPKDVFTPDMVGTTLEVSNSENVSNDGKFLVTRYLNSGMVDLGMSPSTASDGAATSTIHLSSRNSFVSPLREIRPEDRAEIVLSGDESENNRLSVVSVDQLQIDPLFTGIDVSGRQYVFNGPESSTSDPLRLGFDIGDQIRLGATGGPDAGKVFTITDPVSLKVLEPLASTPGTVYKFYAIKRGH
jgi:hypothetical protein